MKRSGFVGVVTGASILGWTLSGAVHEVGHALAYILLGGKVHAIQPFWFLGAPRVSGSGLTLPAHLAIMFASGMLLTVAVGLLLLLAARRVRDPLAGFAVALGAIPFLFQPLTFVALPLLQWMGANVAPHDDAVRFLVQSGWHPLAVAGAAALLLAGAGAMAARAVPWGQWVREQRAAM